MLQKTALSNDSRRCSISSQRGPVSGSLELSSGDDFLEQDSLMGNASTSNGQSLNWRAVMPAKGKRWHPWMICGMKAALVFTFILLLGVLAVSFFPDDIHRILKIWGKPGHIGYGMATWPTDFSRGILPIPCHSHNDYWRHVPLYSAISAGCISVEADIWLFKRELYVGHSISSLNSNRTLDSLYINPLLDILSKQNPKNDFNNGSKGLDGVFDTTPSQSLTLLIDFKTSGSELWPYVLSALQPLRDHDFLTHLNGTQIIQRPITVVGTGNTPFDLVVSGDSNPYRDVFFDAPLDELYDAKSGGATKTRKDYNASNSFYASVSFEKVFGRLNHGRFSDKQLELLRSQVKIAHDKGLKARYWELPYWPISLRNHVWDILVKENVDLLNVDDLNGATQMDWTKPQDGFWWWWW